MLLIIEFKVGNLPNSYTVKKQCIEDNANKIDVLVFGSSQAHSDINPEQFYKYSCNLANSNQDLYYDSQLLDKYIDKMPTLKTVFIGVSYFSLEFSLVENDESWRKYFYYKTFDIPQPNGETYELGYYSYIAAYNPSVVRGFLAKAFDVNLVDKNTTSGWFKFPKDNHAFNENVGAIRARLHTSQMKEKNLNQNVSYLKMMVSRLKAHDVNVYLITFPATSSYRSQIDQKKYNLMTQTVSQITKEFGAYYLNFFDNEQFVKSDFADDSDHLNEIGVDKLTTMIKNNINYEN